jgi:hypothetical protein
VAHITPRPLYPSPSRRYTFSIRLGETQSRSKRFGEEKIFLLLPRFEPQIVKPVIIIIIIIIIIIKLEA